MAIRFRFAWRNTLARMLMISLLVLHGGLVAWIDANNSPNSNELGHLAAGVDIWQSGRFNLYSVNPPLVRTLAALPVICGCSKANWRSLNEEPHDFSRAGRPEFSAGIGLVRDNPDQVMWFFTLCVGRVFH